MPTARVSRTIHAAPEDLWRIVSDPYHLPRWWPRVERVEDVADGAFTEVMRTRAGKTVRADFDLLRADEGGGVVHWQQRLEGTPFGGVLAHSETELHIEPAAGPAAAGLGGEGAPSSQVTIEMRQELSGKVAPAEAKSMPIPRVGQRRVLSLGGWMLRRAATRTIGEALDGLERISA